MVRAKVTGQTLIAVEAFAWATQDVRNDIATRCQGRRYARGDFIIQQKDADHGVFFVVSGGVRVTYFASNGREVAFRDMGSGEMFGELAALDGNPRSARVVATGPTFIAWLPRGEFRELMRGHNELNSYVVCHVVRLVRLLSDKLIEVSTLGVVNRIHAELLRLARKAGVVNNRAVIAPCPSRQDIANRVITQRERVSREITALCKKGLLEKNGRTVIVTDVSRLALSVEAVAAL